MSRDGKRQRPINSITKIAQLLDAEGFSDYTCNQIDRWWQRNRVKTERQQKALERVEKAFGELCASKLITPDRLVLGKFIGAKAKASFEAGLTMGLMAAVVRNITASQRSADPGTNGTS